MKVARAFYTKGFTLLEVMVALTILALALAAASRTAGLATQHGMESKQRLLAGWVAQNRLVEYTAANQWPDLGVTTGSTLQGGIDFSWKAFVTSTPHPQFRRVEISVSMPEQQDYTVARLVGYLAQPN